MTSWGWVSGWIFNSPGLRLPFVGRLGMEDASVSCLMATP